MTQTMSNIAAAQGPQAGHAVALLRHHAEECIFLLDQALCARCQQQRVWYCSGTVGVTAVGTCIDVTHDASMPQAAKIARGVVHACVIHGSIVLQHLSVTARRISYSRTDRDMCIARQSLQLSDGRKLGYAMFGRSVQELRDALAVIYHHGWPSSCMEGTAWDAAAAEQGICMIAVDRPGVGGSTLNPSASFSSYASDINQLMSHLNLTDAVHMGTSGGGPYACACAALNPNTTAGLALVASMTHCSGPGSAGLMQGMDWSNRLMFTTIAHAPQLTAMSLAVAAPLALLVPTVARLLTADSKIAVHDRGCTSTSTHDRHNMMPDNSVVNTVGSCKDDSAQAAGSAVEHQVRGDTPAGVQHEHNVATSSAVNSMITQQQQQQQQQPVEQGLLRRWLRIALKAALYASSLALPAPDRQALLQQPGKFLSILPQVLNDAFVQGSQGLFQDMRLTTLPWGFDLTAIKARALVFQGDADVNVTVAQAKYFVQHIADAELHVVHGAAHFSLVACHARDVLFKVKTAFGDKHA